MSPPSDRSTPVRPPTGGAVDAFLDRAKNVAVASASGRGRLIFALDATMSRQPTWDMAMALQGAMFDTAASLGGLDVQLVYFRGLGECRASSFVSGGAGLAALMTKISCRGGNTQISRVLTHARDEAKVARTGALVFVGDAMEENPGHLFALAGELGLLGVKAFMFHEGDNPHAGESFREMARLTNGAYARFDASSAGRLKALLAAAAAYAAGGLKALEKRAHDGEQSAQHLLSQLR